MKKLMNERVFIIMGLAVSLLTAQYNVGDWNIKGSAQWKPVSAEIPKDGKLRIIAFGAHPDDCEQKAGGTAAMWAAQGHHVKFVSVTNGDLGHWQMAGGPLAQRRRAEVENAARIFGIKTEVLDIHDGEIMPTLENRKRIVRLIREWKADIVLCHRPNDYHPDHRSVGMLVQDAAFMVMVPYLCPMTPYLVNNPTLLYYSDRFTNPKPFQPDIIVSTDGVMDKKLEALAGMESQFSEGGCCRKDKAIPKDRKEAQKKVKEQFRARFKKVTEKYRDLLVEYYGKKKGNKVQYAEAFQVSEYGHQPNKKELIRLFPFFKGN